MCVFTKIFVNLFLSSATRVGASNLKGILTRQRQPKAAAHLIRARYSYLRQMWEYDSTKELMSMQDRALSLEKAKQHSGH